MGDYKISQLQDLLNNPRIQEALKSSNDQFSAMSPPVLEKFMESKENEWLSAPKDKSTQFMLSIINNEVADILREKLVIQSEEFGEGVFGEHILTNSYGANVAVTGRTDNYDQTKDDDDWWQKTKQVGLYIRQCTWDKSAEMNSEDIAVKIFDDQGKFLGILNSATPCDVLTAKTLENIIKIEIVPSDNISPKGNYKISKLQELMKSPIIQKALKTSNEEFSAMAVEVSTLNEDIKWPTEGEPTALQLSIINNEVADILRENMETKSEEFDRIFFGEFILTNAYGANVASTMRTFDYIHNTQEWWQVAAENGILVRQCGLDESVQMYSEDIIIAIYDDAGEFVGVLNSATPCDVILNKSPVFYGDSN
jgi:hypothetical protein